MRYNALAGVKSLLWLPVPAATTILLRIDTPSAYWLFVVWGTVGFLLQTVAHWLRLSQDRTIEQAYDEWMLVSDRRYWELEHKSAGAIAGRLWLNLTSVLIHSWAVAFAVTLSVSGTTSPAYRLLGVAVAVFSAACLCFSGVRLGTDLVRRSVPGWVQVLGRADGLDAVARIVVLGLITGWLIVMGLVY
jgi:hypothetical protein